jgi:DNA-binding Xre family transcriptional regulator
MLLPEVICHVCKRSRGRTFPGIVCRKGIKPNELANRAGVTPSSVYSMLDSRRKEVSVNLVKKLCDGLDITLGQFFCAKLFDELEQEIR